jgi:hypothetical protein
MFVNKYIFAHNFSIPLINKNQFIMKKIALFYTLQHSKGIYILQLENGKAYKFVK